MKRIAQQLSWFVVLVALFIASLGATWFAMAKIDYGFSTWYQVYGIEQHIDRYGPQNRYIRGLDRIPPEEHIRLFGDITRSVHNQGEGLAEIHFERNGRQITLLREPEVVHLQDVANLIDILRIATMAAVAMAALGTLWLLRSRCRLIMSWQLSCLAALIGGTTMTVFIAGPLEVFYYLHTVIFPPEHEWFFYYQDSLMATVMKAPDVFGGIAAAIAIGGVLLFAGLMAMIVRLASRRAAHT